MLSKKQKKPLEQQSRSRVLLFSNLVKVLKKRGKLRTRSCKNGSVIDKKASMTKKFRRFIPHLIVMLASIMAYFFYDSRTHKPQNFEKQQNQVAAKTSEVQPQENKNCNPPQELLNGKKYANSGCLIMQNGEILVVSRKDKPHTKTAENSSHKNEPTVKSAIPGGRKTKTNSRRVLLSEKHLNSQALKLRQQKNFSPQKTDSRFFFAKEKLKFRNRKSSTEVKFHLSSLQKLRIINIQSNSPKLKNTFQMKNN